MRQLLLLIERWGELPHYRLVQDSSPSLARELELFRAHYPESDGYRVRLVPADSYSLPLGDEISLATLHA